MKSLLSLTDVVNSGEYLVAEAEAGSQIGRRSVEVGGDPLRICRMLSVAASRALLRMGPLGRGSVKNCKVGNRV